MGHPAPRRDACARRRLRLPNAAAGVRGDRSIEQVMNVATLPGIVKASFAMPDIHWGYGFPDRRACRYRRRRRGVVSPGGVGFDISCGVRLLATSMDAEHVRPRLEELMAALRRIACRQGGREPASGDSTTKRIDQVLRSRSARRRRSRIRHPRRPRTLRGRWVACRLTTSPASAATRCDRGLGQLGSLGVGQSLHRGAARRARSSTRRPPPPSACAQGQVTVHDPHRLAAVSGIRSAATTSARC